MTIASDAVVTVSERLYRLLLAAYPPGHRREYGAPMAQVFRDCCRDAYRRRGVLGVFQLWVPTLGDLASTAVVERITEGLHMSSRLLRISGLAAILGGLVWMVGVPGLSEALPGVTHAGGHMLLALAGLLTLLGMVGLYARYAGRSGRLGWTGFLMGLIGLPLIMIGNAIEGLFEEELGWMMFGFGMLFLLVGLVLVGVAALRTNALPRWSALPLVIIPLAVVSMMIGPSSLGIRLDESSTGEALMFGLIGLFGISWMLLGYALWSDQGEVAVPPLAAS